MQIDPVSSEWQRLTAEYRDKDEGELLELARDYADLTPNRAAGIARRDAQPRIGRSANPRASAPQADVSATRIISARGRQIPSRSPLLKCSAITQPAYSASARNAAARPRQLRIRRTTTMARTSTRGRHLFAIATTNDEAQAALQERCGRRASIVGSSRRREFGRRRRACHGRRRSTRSGASHRRTIRSAEDR